MGEDFDTEEIPFVDIARIDRFTFAILDWIGDRLAVVRIVRRAKLSIRMNWGTAEAKQG